MASLKIYYGAEKPYTAVGHNQSRFLNYAHAFPVWHYLPDTRAGKRAIAGLERRGSVVVDRERGMYKINDGRN